MSGAQGAAWRAWAGMFSGPLAWALQLNIGFAITHWFCEESPAHVTLYAVSIGALAIALGGLAVSWKVAPGRMRNGVRSVLHMGRGSGTADVPEPATEPSQRSLASLEFVAMLSVLVGALSVAGIVAGALAVLIFGGCQ